MDVETFERLMFKIKKYYKSNTWQLTTVNIFNFGINRKIVKNFVFKIHRQKRVVNDDQVSARSVFGEIRMKNNCSTIA